MTWPAPVDDGMRGTFVVGDRVVARGDFGPLVCDVRLRYDREPLAEYDVVEVTAGRWLLLRGDDGELYGGTRGLRGEVRPAIGHSYFKIVGECGGHRPVYRGDRGLAWEWECARCDEPTPDAVSTYHLYGALGRPS